MGNGRALGVMGLFVLFSGCSELEGSRQIPEASGPETQLGQSTQAVWGGHRDYDTVEANVVVRLEGRFGECTGTLITPYVVLTANHCITGWEDDYVLDDRPQVFIGANRPGHGILSGAPAEPYRNEAVKHWEIGQDLALVYLLSPALDDAKVVRPSLRAPAPCCTDDDSNGGTYIGPIGFAGWSQYLRNDSDINPDAVQHRQVAPFSSIDLDHYPNYPGGGRPGQIWLHSQNGSGTSYGDSGGPLYLVRNDPGCTARSDCGTRDVIGVMSSTVYDWTEAVFDDNDVWTDITRGIPAEWLISKMEDTSHDHQPNWLRKHPRMTPGRIWHDNAWVEKWRPIPGRRWRGELDYSGPRQTAFDSDNDHWYNEHDNCPSQENFDQADQDDDGIGDACDTCPGTAGGGEKTNRLVDPNGPGDACNPLPLTKIAQNPDKPGYVLAEDPGFTTRQVSRRFSHPVLDICMPDSSDTLAPVHADNILDVAAIGAGQEGNTAVLFCTCARGGLACNCPDAGLGGDWKAMTLENMQEPESSELQWSTMRTWHRHEPASGKGTWAWKYWRDLSLPPPIVASSPIPVWSGFIRTWVASHGNPRPDPRTITAQDMALRYSDPIWVELHEYAPPYDNSRCKPHRLVPIAPIISRDCIKCGKLLARAWDLVSNPADLARTTAAIDLTSAIRPDALKQLRKELGNKPSSPSTLSSKLLFGGNESVFDISKAFIDDANTGLGLPSATLDFTRVDTCFVRVGDDDTASLLGRMTSEGTYLSAGPQSPSIESKSSIVVATPCKAEPDPSDFPLAELDQ